MPHFDDYVHMNGDLADGDVFSDHSAYGVITNFMASKISNLITRVDDKLCRLIVAALSHDDRQAIAFYRLFLGTCYNIEFIFAQIGENIIQITPSSVRRFSAFMYQHPEIFQFIGACVIISASMFVSIEALNEAFPSWNLIPPTRVVHYANQDEQEERLKRTKTSIFMFKYSESPDLKGFKGIGKTYIGETWLTPIGKGYIRETKTNYRQVIFNGKTYI